MSADVAFDARLTSHMSDGMTRYVRRLAELLPAVAPDLRFAFVGRGDNFDLAEQAALPLEIVRARARLAHVPTPFVPALLPGRFVVTVHDLIDLHYPQYGKRKVGPYYRLIVGPVLRRAAAVITDDAATASDLQSLLGVDPQRIAVVPLGSDLLPSKPATVGGTPYFLYVGNRRPHKDLDTLQRAWAALEPPLAADLVVTGSPHDGPPLEPAAVAAGRVVYTGACSDAELARWYSGARAYVHPALREGFGLPMLEAMRAGAPVIAAASALPVVLAPHAFAFAPGDVRALRALLEHALREPDSFRAAAAHARDATAGLTWASTARATAEVYRRCLA